MDHPNLIISNSMENFNSLIKGQKKKCFYLLRFVSGIHEVERDWQVEVVWDAGVLIMLLIL